MNEETSITEWIDHDGSGMPVSGHVEVEVECRDGYTATARADHFAAEKNAGCNWWAIGMAGEECDEIISYRVSS